MRFLKGKAITYITLIIMLIIFIGTLITTLIYSSFSSNIDAQRMTIDGKYSIDGGEWKNTIPNKMSDSDFEEVVIKGKFTRNLRENETLIISATNAWFTLQAEGQDISTNHRADDGAFKNTPGYSLMYISNENLKPNSNITLRVKCPYTIFSSKNLVDYIDLYAGDEGTVYELLFQHKALTILFCVLICFFGLFAFPIAGIVLGGIDYKYLTFSILCFFAGLFILTQSIYGYLPIWIDDPVLSMSICAVCNFLFAISALIYIKVGLSKPSHKITGNIIIMVFVSVVIASIALHQMGIQDCYTTKPFVFIMLVICAVAITICLLREAKADIETITLVASWLPLVVSMIFDILNEFFGFADYKLIQTGTAVMLLIQLAKMIYDLRQQYKETIRYQQMQKELYESRVAIMVSQIQPHFLYNSLTSIAMMCTKDPKVAKTATINFADYLRGNMNSLKEKNPVPFEREFEHLKKYIMLEQLRFGDMLNIEYDIETDEFLLPQLSVQPLVENAIKHGVGMKEDGGTVKISTRETDKYYEVIVSDDGVGFDTEKTVSDGREHVGMNNVKQRLKEMCNAELTIESEVGKGTVSTIRIPKGEEE